MRLSEIWIYPVKSLGGIRLKESQVEERGLKYDRRWMIVDENGKFITQRVNIRMALIDVSFSDQGFILSQRLEPENQVLLPFVSKTKHPLLVKVWHDELLAYTVCDKVDAWLSIALGRAVRIVSMQESVIRKMHPEHSENGNIVSFADDFPYLLISEGSLNDLNRRLDIPVEMMRFRPNFVVSGTGAFAEDEWKYIKIGDITFEVAKSCERCVLTTIDPATGTKGMEPLKTLATYRRVNKKVLFGQNLVSLKNGNIFEGAEITLLE